MLGKKRKKPKADDFRTCSRKVGYQNYDLNRTAERTMIMMKRYNTFNLLILTDNNDYDEKVQYL